MKVITTTRSLCGRVAVQVRQDDIWGEFYTFCTVDGQPSKLARIHHTDNEMDARVAALEIADAVAKALPAELALVDKG